MRAAYDRSFQLAHTRTHIFGDEPDNLFGNRQLEVVELRLLAKDGDPVLEIGHLDVGDHSPVEARNESRLEARDFLRRPIAGENDLPPGFIEGVERVKELLLHRLLPLEEVNVVDEEEVRLAEPAAEIGRGAVLNRGHELVGELLGADEGDSSLWLPEQDLVRDGLHEVGLPQPGVAIDEERVVDLAWGLADGVRRGGCELVGFPDDEVLERVPIT